eukprot:8932273-Pyramimonas_sp.AAC.1
MLKAPRMVLPPLKRYEKPKEHPDEPDDGRNSAGDNPGEGDDPMMQGIQNPEFTPRGREFTR